MVTDEMLKRAVEAYAKDTGAEDWVLEGWIEPAIRAALDAALSAAEPAAWVYAPDLAKGSGGFGKEKGSVLMSLDGEWINVDTPLYPAPPAPSVVVKEAEPVAWRCKDFADGWILDHSERSAREYQRKTGCLIQPLYTTPPTISVAIENLSDEQIRHIADAKDVASCRSRIRSALSARVQDVAENGLTLSALQSAHVERQEEWCPDVKPDLSFRGNELGGECGEAQNVIKKLERERHGWRGSRDTVEHLAEELADVIHCSVLVAITAGVDLQQAVIAKFNDTSMKNGLSVMLPAAPAKQEGDRNEAN